MSLHIILKQPAVEILMKKERSSLRNFDFKTHPTAKNTESLLKNQTDIQYPAGCGCSDVSSITKNSISEMQNR